jgi:DNA-binding protein HU-beta
VATLKVSSEIRLPGFGAFDVTEAKVREGGNTRTGETIKIKAPILPVFKSAKGLKDIIN